MSQFTDAQLTEIAQVIQSYAESPLPLIDRRVSSGGPYRGTALIEYLSTLPKTFTSFQKSVLIGCILGDVSLQRSAKNTFAKIDQNVAHQQFVHVLYSVFRDYVGTSPALRYVKQKPHSYNFKTFRLERLNWYYDLFYQFNPVTKTDIKTIPDTIHRYLNPVSLAFWYMTDGSKNKSGVYFHTEGFSYSCCRKLQQALGKNFGFEVSLHKDTRRELAAEESKTFYKLYIPKKQVDDFKKIVEPFMVPCMLYKL